MIIPGLLHSRAPGIPIGDDVNEFISFSLLKIEILVV